MASGGNIIKGVKVGKGGRQTYSADGIEKVEDTVINGANGAVSVASGVVGAAGFVPFVAPMIAGVGISGVKGVGKLTGSTVIQSAGVNLEAKVAGITDKTFAESFNGKLFAPIGRASTRLATKTSGLLSSVGLKSAASVVADTPSALAAKPVGAGLMEASFIAGSGLQMASGALGFAKSLAVLKQMAFDLTGKRYSTIDLLFKDNVPEVIKNERGQILKSLTVDEAGGAISMGVAIKSAARVVSGWVWPVVMGATIGASMLVGEGMLSVYAEATKAFNSGQPLPPDVYAKIVGVSKELINRGGEQGAFAQAVATQYAAENANPVDVVREIESGALRNRIEKIIAENDARDPAKAEVKSPEEQPKISHVAALEQPRDKKPLAHLVNKEREIIGDKTRDIVNSALANNQMVGHVM